MAIFKSLNPSRNFKGVGAYAWKDELYNYAAKNGRNFAEEGAKAMEESLLGKREGILFLETRFFYKKTLIFYGKSVDLIRMVCYHNIII